jgi:thioredoxin reductase/ferredoxin
VAIIGAGPSGLTCGYFLAKLGHSVTIYEAAAVPGGMIAMGIPEFRIPMELLLWEVKMITQVGINIIYNTKVGKDIALEDLRKQYDAVYMAMGLPGGKNIGLEGENAIGFYEAVDFLRNVKLNLHFGKPLPPIGKKVVVLGGGNVAIDVVRTVKRMGAESVEMYCIESRQQMPAWQSEVEEALEEGVCLGNGWGPDKILLDKSGKVTGILFKQCVSVFDEQGRFNPQYCVDDMMKIEADTVIKAFGQSPMIDFVRQTPGIQYFRNQWITVNPQTMATGAEGLFAGGDLIKPGLLIDAIANGRQAAKAIDIYLGGAGKLHLDTSISIPLPSLAYYNRPVERINHRFISMIDRETTFKESTLLMDADEAYHECERCLCCEPPTINTKKCMGCGTCVSSCPWDALSLKITIEKDIFGEKKVRKSTVDPTKCHTCAVCVTECPINAISMMKWSDQAYFKEFSKISQSGEN